jgi:putative endonuclease
MSFSRAAFARGNPGSSPPYCNMRERTYFVYIMASPSRTLYSGVTNNLERRVAEHKKGATGTFTTRYRVARLVYFEEFDDVTNAIAREKRIKKLLRAEKIALIESGNSDWRDLSEGWE